MIDKEKLLQLYPGYIKVSGPFLRRDNRKTLVLTSIKGSKYNKGLSFPKALLEISINRVLVGDETTDHIDGDKTNDDLSNLQVLSRQENARKSAIGNDYSKGYKQWEDEKRSGDKNGMAKITNEQVLYCRRKFTSGELSVKDIMLNMNMCNKGVRNFLFGYSFKDVPEPCTPGKIGRPKSKK